jgi:hypothetical protein
MTVLTLLLNLAKNARGYVHILCFGDRNEKDQAENGAMSFLPWNKWMPIYPYMNGSSRMAQKSMVTKLKRQQQKDIFFGRVPTRTSSDYDFDFLPFLCPSS